MDSGGASANSESCDVPTSGVADAKTESDTAEKVASDGECKPVAEGENQSANKTDVVVSTDLPEGNPRPFCYIFIKTVNATYVVVPSLLIVIAEEEVNTDAMADDAKKEDFDFQQ